MGSNPTFGSNPLTLTAFRATRLVSQHALRSGHMEPTRVVWMVDDDRTFREMSDQVAIEADIAVVTMGVDELAIRRRTHDLPAGIMLDGSVLSTTDAEHMLTGIPRIVICTGREYASIAENWARHAHVRVLLKPMELDQFEGAIRWMAGADDGSSWPTPEPIKR